MERPLLGIVSRFTRQKGTDILAEAIGDIVAEDVYLVALGTGDAGVRGVLPPHGGASIRAASPCASASTTGWRIASRPAPTCS